MDIVLAAHHVYYLLRVESFGMQCCFGHHLHECLHDFVSAQFDGEYWSAVVDFLYRHACASLVGVGHSRRDFFHERAFEFSVENFLFVCYKGIDAFIYKQSDDSCTHVDHHFVFVADAFGHDAFFYLLLRVWVEETQQHALRFGEREYLQFVGVFDVHYLVAYIVGCLDEVHQRMACPSFACGRLFDERDAEFVGYALVDFLLRGEEPELPVAAGHP